MKYYKWLSLEREPVHGGSGQYPPPGEWTEPVAVDPCRSGYHVCRVGHISQWVPYVGASLWEVDCCGLCVVLRDKVVFESVRLVRPLRFPKRARELWKADCAAHVLHLLERAHPGDSRVRDAIVARRRLTAGGIDFTAYDEAYTAADAVAGVHYSATMEVRAAWATARDAEHIWQGMRLLAYADAAERGETLGPWQPGRSKR